MELYQKQDEKALLALLIKGDEKAFTVIYDRYKRRLYLFGFKFLKSAELTEELIQDVFIKIWDTRKNLDLSLSFNSYIHTICKNLILNHLKKAARNNQLDNNLIPYNAEDFIDEPEETFQKEWYAKVAFQALENLPPQRRKVFTLCKMEGNTYEQVSANLGISKNAVKDHMVKGMKTIREFLTLHSEITSIIILFFYL